jgi:hypothetical protein
LRHTSHWNGLSSCRAIFSLNCSNSVYQEALFARGFSVDRVLLALVLSIDGVLSQRSLSLEGVLLARFFSEEKVLSKVFFSAERALLARVSVDGVLLERFLSVDPALPIHVACVLSVELFTDIRSIHSGWSGSFRLLLSSVPDPDPHVFGLPGSGSFYHQAKIIKKTLLPTVL